MELPAFQARSGRRALHRVDPYYLIRKAEDYGFHPGLILYGRRINDTMGEYIAGRVVKCMIKKMFRCGMRKHWF